MCLKQPAMPPRQFQHLLPDSGDFSSETANMQIGWRILRAIWRPQTQFCGIVAESVDEVRHEPGHLVPAGCLVLQGRLTISYFDLTLLTISACRHHSPRQIILCTVNIAPADELLAVSQIVNAPPWGDSVKVKRATLISFHPDGWYSWSCLTEPTCKITQNASVAGWYVLTSHHHHATSQPVSKVCMVIISLWFSTVPNRIYASPDSQCLGSFHLEKDMFEVQPQADNPYWKAYNSSKTSNFSESILHTDNC